MLVTMDGESYLTTIPVKGMLDRIRKDFPHLGAVSWKPCFCLIFGKEEKKDYSYVILDNGKTPFIPGNHEGTKNIVTTTETATYRPVLIPLDKNHEPVYLQEENPDGSICSGGSLYVRGQIKPLPSSVPYHLTEYHILDFGDTFDEGSMLHWVWLNGVMVCLNPIVETKASILKNQGFFSAVSFRKKI